MKTKVAATYVAGQFKPDEDLPLADDTRVTLTVEVIENDLVDDEPGPSPQESKAAWERLQARLKELLFTAAANAIRRTNCMNAVDANVFVYAIDDDAIKQAQANELLERLSQNPADSVTLWQAAANS